MSNAIFYKWRVKYGGIDASIWLDLKSLNEKCSVKENYAKSKVIADVLLRLLEKK